MTGMKLINVQYRLRRVIPEEDWAGTEGGENGLPQA